MTHRLLIYLQKIQVQVPASQARRMRKTSVGEVGEFSSENRQRWSLCNSTGAIMNLHLWLCCIALMGGVVQKHQENYTFITPQGDNIGPNGSIFRLSLSRHCWTTSPTCSHHWLSWLGLTDTAAHLTSFSFLVYGSFLCLKNHEKQGFASMQLIFLSGLELYCLVFNFSSYLF